MHRAPRPSARATSSTCAAQNSAKTSSVLSMIDSAPAGADVLASPASRSAAHEVWGRPRAPPEGTAHARRHGRDDARAVPGARCARDARGAAAIAASAVACDMVPSCAASSEFFRNPTVRDLHTGTMRRVARLFDFGERSFETTRGG